VLALLLSALRLGSFFAIIVRSRPFQHLYYLLQLERVYDTTEDLATVQTVTPSHLCICVFPYLGKRRTCSAECISSRSSCSIKLLSERVVDLRCTALSTNAARTAVLLLLQTMQLAISSTRRPMTEFLVPRDSAIVGKSAKLWCSHACSSPPRCSTKAWIVLSELHHMHEALLWPFANVAGAYMMVCPSPSRSSMGAWLLSRRRYKRQSIKRKAHSSFLLPFKAQHHFLLHVIAEHTAITSTLH